MNGLSQTVLWCMVQLTVISGATVLLARFAGRRNPAAGVWCLRTGIVLALAITFIAPAPLPSWFSLTNAEPADGTQIAETVGATDSVTSAEPTLLADETTTSATGPLWENLKTAFQNIASTPVEAVPSAGQTEQTEVPAASGFDSLSPLAWVMIAGVSLGTTWFLIGLVSVQLLLRNSEPVTDARVSETLDIVLAELSCTRPIRLVETERIASAATVGFFRPVVLLPTAWYEWSDQELHAVVAHEISHVQANDFAATVLAQLVVAIHFFHPFVHYLSRQLRITQELAADASASTLAGGRTDYATVLAGMALRTNSQSNLWATQAFLPAPRTLLRRVEMLRDATTLRTGLSRPARVFLTSALVLTMCAVAGLRANPIALAINETEPTEPVATATADPVALQESKPLSLDWIPNGSMGVFAFKPNEFLNHEVGKPLAKMVTEKLQEAGIAIGEIDSVTICQVHPSKAGNSGRRGPRLAVGDFWIIRNRVKTDWKAFLKEVQGSASFVADDFTIVIADNSDVMTFVKKSGKRGTSNRFWHEQWKQLADKPAAALFDIGAFREASPNAIHQMFGQPLFEATSPIWGAGELLAVSLTPADNVELSATITSVSEGHGDEITSTAKAGLTLMRNIVMNQERSLARSPQPDAAVVADLMGLAGASLKTATVDLQGTNTLIKFTFPASKIAGMAERMGPVLAESTTRAARVSRINNLRQIALALHNYHAVYGHFPPAYSLGKDGNGPHPVSWRVLITPFIERNDIFQSYHFDEPFDSPHNQKVTAEMPAVFARPIAGGDPESSRMTSVFAILSTDAKRPTGFGRHKGARIRDFLDGTANSILVVEAKRDIHWAKPEDIEWNPAGPLPDLGGFAGDNFLAARADGSVSYFNPKRSPVDLTNMLTISDGQIVDQSQLQPE